MLNKPKGSSLYAKVRENEGNLGLIWNLGKKTWQRISKLFQTCDCSVLVSLVDLVFLFYECRQLDSVYFYLKMIFIHSSIFQIQEKSALKVRLDELSC